MTGGRSPEIVVIGAGIAGAAIAAHLSEHASVRLLEMEAQPGYHSTGRSAAVFCSFYGNAAVRALTRASRTFFVAPPSGFWSEPLVRPRALLLIAREGQQPALRRILDSTVPDDGVEEKSALEATQLHPLLRTDGLRAAACTERAADIDVHALQRGYLRLFRSRGGVLTNNAQVVALERSSGHWLIRTNRDDLRAEIVVNAAGAWADMIAGIAGVRGIGLRSLKRTACLIPAPPLEGLDRLPMLVDAEETFYMKPDAGALLLSPADETSVPPGDAQADDLDVAIAVERVEAATTLTIERVTHKWAGLRSFVVDRSPVVGFDPVEAGFFWFGALGGYGIQTAPALSRLAATIALGMRPDESVIAQGVDASALSPRRLAVS